MGEVLSSILAKRNNMLLIPVLPISWFSGNAKYLYSNRMDIIHECGKFLIQAFCHYVKQARNKTGIFFVVNKISFRKTNTNDTKLVHMRTCWSSKK